MKNSWSAKVFALFTFTHKFPKDKREFILDNDTLWEYTLSNLCTPIIAKYFLLICKIEIFGKNIFHRIPYSEFLYTDVENLSVEKQQFFNRRKGHFSTISPYDVSLPNSKEYVPTLLRSKERAKEIKEQMDKEERKNSLREKIKKNMASRN
ncbi:MAG: hypothetical protein EKK64_01150 [Neisseriaceae bacterium]|nr:MAG: hypothetical protein EKK64_01150 [Neisseriaceae bacterium]